MAFHPVDIARAAIARTFGIRNSIYALDAARKLPHVGPALAVAVLEQESGGKNVWGHDPTIFIGGFDRKNNRYWTTRLRRGYVNERGYREYKKQRGPTGRGGMQGVGPMQLTWWEFQDGADRAGGCWKPPVNIAYGLKRLNDLIAAHGFREGIKRYNGTGPAADRYATMVIARTLKWRKRFNIK